jgi:hypothetical protein
MDTTAKVIYGGSLVLAMIAGACIMALFLMRRFDRELEEDRDTYHEEEAVEHTGWTEELTALLSGEVAVPPSAERHDTEEIRYAEPTRHELLAARAQHGYIPELDPYDTFPDDDAPTGIILTRTTVTESVELPVDHLTDDCDAAILEIRRRFSIIRENIGCGLELVGAP